MKLLSSNSYKNVVVKKEDSSMNETFVVFRMLLSAHGSFVFVSQK